MVFKARNPEQWINEALGAAHGWQHAYRSVELEVERYFRERPTPADDPLSTRELAERLAPITKRRNPLDPDDIDAIPNPCLKRVYKALNSAGKNPALRPYFTLAPEKNHWGKIIRGKLWHSPAKPEDDLSDII